MIKLTVYFIARSIPVLSSPLCLDICDSKELQMRLKEIWDRRDELRSTAKKAPPPVANNNGNSNFTRGFGSSRRKRWVIHHHYLLLINARLSSMLCVIRSCWKVLWRLQQFSLSEYQRYLVCEKLYLFIIIASTLHCFVLGAAGRGH